MLFRDQYFFLSNFCECTIKCNINGKDLCFPSVECAFQAHKNFELADKFTLLSSLEAKKYGKRVKLTTPNWETYKVYLMGRLLIQKFRNFEFFLKLKKVEGEIVEDNYWGDTYWGVCKGEGKNVLGKLLMHIRDNNCDEKALENYISKLLLTL